MKIHIFSHSFKLVQAFERCLIYYFSDNSILSEKKLYIVYELQVLSHSLGVPLFIVINDNNSEDNKIRDFYKLKNSGFYYIKEYKIKYLDNSTIDTVKSFL